MVPNHPLNGRHLESELFLLFVPLSIDFSLAIVMCLVMLKIHEKFQLLWLAVKETFTIQSHFVFSLLETFVWRQWSLSDFIKSESLGMISELLTIQTDINHVEWVVIVELRNVGQFAYDVVVFVMTFWADPVLHGCFILRLGVVLESNSDAFYVLENQRIQRHVNRHISDSMRWTDFWIACLHWEFWCYVRLNNYSKWAISYCKGSIWAYPKWFQFSTRQGMLCLDFSSQILEPCNKMSMFCRRSLRLLTQPACCWSWNGLTAFLCQWSRIRRK